MKKMILPLAFVLAGGFVFATQLKPLDLALSYKVAGEPSTNCHVITSTDIEECEGGQSDCTIQVGQQTRTYFANNNCTSVLKMD